MLYLDQRGTGLSTPVTPTTLGLRGNNDVQAKYLKLYRADNIVRDCEAIRQALTADYPPEKQKWSTVGQSFGGFCTITYLSFYPEGLSECFIFGGLQALVKSPDEVYRRTYKIVSRRNKAYYEKYPEDVERVKAIVKYLQRFGDGVIKLPSEDNLTVRRFQQLGINFGGHGEHNHVLFWCFALANGSKGGLDYVHGMVSWMYDRLGSILTFLQTLFSARRTILSSLVISPEAPSPLLTALETSTIT